MVITKQISFFWAPLNVASLPQAMISGKFPFWTLFIRKSALSGALSLVIVSHRWRATSEANSPACFKLMVVSSDQEDARQNPENKASPAPFAFISPLI
mmetsp:Transcript_13601/g.17270  ORF Transcript_13601/g.17270 Transcript_13601/m.17270 type:complete len:98 (-) Transcript_13601:42-335(-)